jgi:hypothetical protein
MSEQRDPKIDSAIAELVSASRDAPTFEEIAARVDPTTIAAIGPSSWRRWQMPGWVTATGAAILVVVLVGLIPWLFDGGEPDTPLVADSSQVPDVVSPIPTVDDPSPVPSLRELTGYWVVGSEEAGLPEGGVNAIAADPSGVVWAIGSDGVVYRLETDGWENVVPTPEGFEAGVWMAVTGHGQIVTHGYQGTDTANNPAVLVYDGSQWRALVAEGLFPDEFGPPIRRILPNGDLVIAGITDAPYMVRIGADEIEYTVGDISPGSAPGGPFAHGAMTITTDGVFWAGGATDITVFDGSVVTILEPPVMGADAVCCVAPLAEDPTGGMWIQVATNLYHYDTDGWRLVADTDQLPSTLVAEEWRIIGTPDGHVWLFHKGGVGHYDGMNWNVYTTGNAIDTGMPTGYYGGTMGSPITGPDGSVWIVSNATGQLRIYKYTDTGWAVAPEGGAPMRQQGHINGIFTVTPDGSAWLVTTSGAARFTPIK